MTVYDTFSKIDKNQWTDLVEKSSTSSYFQSPECFDFFASTSFLKPFVFGVSENNRLVGILTGYITSDGNFIKRYFSKRAIVCGGALLDPDISEKALKLLLITAKKNLKRKAIYLEIRNYNNYSHYKNAFNVSGFSYQPHLNFHVSTPNVETALKNLSTTRRREIKLSIKSGAVWYETKDLDDIKIYYKILEDLYKTKVKTPLYPLEFFEKLADHSNGKIFIVKLNDKIIGGSVCVMLLDKTIYEWFVCGLDGQIKNVFPSTLATWAAIEYASTGGYSCFDMMGAGKPGDEYGVRDFKSKFGGELVENGRFLYISNPLLFSIGKMAVHIIRYKKKPKKTAAKPTQNNQFEVESQIQKIEKNEWDEFVLKHPNGNIFQTPAMYEVYQNTPKFTPIILIAKDKENKIVGCLMSVIQKDYKGMIGEFTARSIVVGGPLAVNNNAEILDLLLQMYNKLVSSKAIYSQFRNLFEMKNYHLQFENNGYKLEEHLDLLIDLRKSKIELEDQLHKERKRNIAQALKEGLIFKVLDDDADIKNVILILKKTYSRVKVPFSYENLFFNSHHMLNDNVKFFGAFCQGKMIAGQVRLCYKDTVYAWYSGSDSDYFQKRPNDFLLWNVILWSKEHNYSIFDFGGAGKPDVPYGVRNYKLKFGGELVNYGRYEKEHKKLLMFLGRIALNLFKITKR